MARQNPTIPGDQLLAADFAPVTAICNREDQEGQCHAHEIEGQRRGVG